MSVEGFRIRVLDLSMGWAGPLVGQLLAEMGAEVIKVEDTRRFDWWRGSQAMGPPEMQPIERAPTFNSSNRGKLGLTLDLSRERGVAVLRRLVACSDVVVENFSPRVMRKLGIGYPELAALNPRLVMLSMPAFGSDGPEAGMRGYGNTIEAMAGVTGLSRYHDGGQPYMEGNALGDPVSGLNGALAVLAALYERQRTGRGQLIEVAQVEALIPFIADALIEYQVAGALPQPIGNRHRLFAPHGIYRCAGDDSWVAFGIAREEDWPALSRVLGLEHLAADTRFRYMAARKRNEDALDREISRATARFQADELARQLAAAGIAAAPVNSAPAVLGDPHLHERGFFVPIERAVVGTHLYPNAVQKLSTTPLRADQPAPLLGEHNRLVICGIAGLSEAELGELEREGIVGTEPRE